MRAAAEVLHGRAVHVVRYATTEVDLVIILDYMYFVDEDKLGYEGGPVQRTSDIKIRDIAHEQVRAVKRDGIAPFD